MRSFNLFQAKKLAGVGETRLRSRVNRMLLKVFSPCIMTKFNMQGKRGEKVAFMGTEISKILVPIARKTAPLEEKATDKKVEQCLASILKGAPARKAAHD